MPVALSRKDLLLLVVLTVLWGVNWPVMKAGVREFPPLGFRALCMAGGAVLLALMARAQGHSLRVEREHWRELALLGLTNMVGWYVLAIWGVKLLSSGRAAILGYTMPVWTALIGWLLYRDRLDARTGLGVLAACAAVGLLLAGELGTLSGRPLGALLMLGAAFTWAIGTQLMRRRTVPGSLVVLTFWMMLMGLATCSAISLTLERDQWTRWPNTVEWAAILYNVFLVFGVSQLLWFRLATILPPVASSLSVMLIPVVGLFSGMALLGERPTWHDWAALGCVLVSIGSVLMPARKVAASTA
ncbi:MAG: EamA family transporter [Burkholderiaceae bacterium]|jgi:drug/metabolite transporter (DMT)-like permease|nr:EamA family transporter [Burkholderiales bacterium]MCZ8337743.1 EamA family transporter [Burkholderiaceae bacterium]